MKRFLLFLLITLLSAPAIANVKVQLTNVPNDKKIFITSLISGERIYAINAGNFAIITPAALKNYRPFSEFTAGIDNGSGVQYCMNRTGGQFTFTASGVGSTSFYLQLVKSYDGIFVPVCKKYLHE